MLLFNKLSGLKRRIPPALKRPVTRSYGGLLSALSKRAHRDYDARRTLLLASSPRSGSTWLLNLMTTLPRACPVFEPLRIGVEAALDDFVSEFTPRFAPETEAPELEAYLGEVFAGRNWTRWSSNYAGLRQLLTADRFVVKFVRANRMMGWIRNHFPENKRVVIVRHPCAVVSSLMRSPGIWHDWSREEILLPARKVLGEDVDDLVGAHATREGLLTAFWAADTVAVVKETGPQDTLLLTYEETSSNPRDVLRRLFDHLDEPMPPNALDSVRRASQTTNAGAAILKGEDPVLSWTRRVSRESVDEILRVARGCGIPFYGTDPQPDLEKLRAMHAEPSGSAMGRKP